MKNTQTFPGTLLLGIGLYFLLQQMDIQLFDGFYSWPTILCIMGIAFLIPAYSGGENDAVLPGVILFGYGLHFHLSGKVEAWPDHIGSLLLITSVALILQERRSNAPLLPGAVLFIISLVTLYYDKMTDWLDESGTGIANPGQYWPFLLIAIGLFFLIRKKGTAKKRS